MTIWQSIEASQKSHTIDCGKMTIDCHPLKKDLFFNFPKLSWMKTWKQKFNCYKNLNQLNTFLNSMTAYSNLFIPLSIFHDYVVSSSKSIHPKTMNFLHVEHKKISNKIMHIFHINNVNHNRFIINFFSLRTHKHSKKWKT